MKLARYGLRGISQCLADMNLHLIEQSDAWVGQSVEIAAVLSAVLAHLGEEETRDLAVVLGDNAEIQRLNRDFRGKDTSTNVLSFPSDEPDEWGDIILAYETIADEALAQGKAFDAHLTHLLVHGMLHLLGYDHMDDAEAEQMEALEVEILAKLAVANPYESA
jgi:probable rRNA maturation factor